MARMPVVMHKCPRCQKSCQRHCAITNKVCDLWECVDCGLLMGPKGRIGVKSPLPPSAP